MIEKRTNNKTYNLVLVAIFTVLVYLTTAILRIPVPSTLGGYYHLGDAVIFVACFLLGFYAVIPAVLGSALADLTVGAVIYMPATIVIKALMAIAVVLILGKRGGRGRFILGTAVASLIMIAGYTIFEYAMFMIGSRFDIDKYLLFAPINILFNGVQAMSSSPVSWLLTFAALKINYVQHRFKKQDKYETDSSGL